MPYQVFFEPGGFEGCVLYAFRSAIRRHLCLCHEISPNPRNSTEGRYLWGVALRYTRKARSFFVGAFRTPMYLAYNRINLQRWRTVWGGRQALPFGYRCLRLNVPLWHSCMPAVLPAIQRYCGRSYRGPQHGGPILATSAPPLTGHQGFDGGASQPTAEFGRARGVAHAPVTGWGRYNSCGQAGQSFVSGRLAAERTSSPVVAVVVAHVRWDDVRARCSRCGRARCDQHRLTSLARRGSRGRASRPRRGSLPSRPVVQPTRAAAARYRRRPGRCRRGRCPRRASASGWGSRRRHIPVRLRVSRRARLSWQ